jgi:hypothetical protein
LVSNNTSPIGRTNQKIKYAKIHLDELKQYEKATSNDDWERAHQESFLFHLIGAVDNILHEINFGYSLKYGTDEVSWNPIRDKLNRFNVISPAFQYLDNLKKDKNNWLDLLYAMRNHCTHRGAIGKFINFASEGRLDNEYKDPRTGKPQQVYPGMKCLELYEKMLSNVEILIKDCREIDSKLKI